MLIHFDEETYQATIQAFQSLPLAAVVNGEYFCVHGGISSRLQSLKSVNEIERFQEPGDEENLFNDLLWADPMKMKETFNHSEKPNDRGISVLFGWAVLEAFLEANMLRALVRAHEQKDDGFKLHMWRGESDDPPCITIFSAPNYC